MLEVAPDILQLGLASSAVVARGVDNTKIVPELIAYRRQVGQRLGGYWKNRSVSSHPAIEEYHRIHSMFGVENEPPAPEKLLSFIRRKRDFTSTSAVVDSYNIVSTRTLLSIGAHDLSKFPAPITLRKCEADDVYVPLGQTERQDVTGEYAYVDADSKVICRLEVLQGDHSKVTRESTDIAFFLQGNEKIAPATLLKGSWLLVEMIEKFCGGEAELVDFLDAGVVNATAPQKPNVSFEEFKSLNLKVGTVQAATPLENNESLTSLTVCARSERQVLAVSSQLPETIAGQQVVLATELHPLKIGEVTFDSYLLSVNTTEGAEAMNQVYDIPDGIPLF